MMRSSDTRSNTDLSVLYDQSRNRIFIAAVLTHIHTHTRSPSYSAMIDNNTWSTKGNYFFSSQANPLPLPFTHIDIQTQTHLGEGTYCHVVLYLHGSFLILFFYHPLRLASSETVV